MSPAKSAMRQMFAMINKGNIVDITDVIIYVIIVLISLYISKGNFRGSMKYLFVMLFVLSVLSGFFFHIEHITGVDIGFFMNCVIVSFIYTNIYVLPLVALLFAASFLRTIKMK
jgi:hypothetical protein